MNRLFFPLSALGFAGLAVAGRSVGLPIEAIPAAVTLLALGLVMFAERWKPRVKRVAEPSEVRTDAIYAALTAVVDALSGAGFAALAIALQPHLPWALLSDISLYAAFPLAMLIAAFGDYWAHRLSHTLPWWWKLHAVHHAPHRMVALNNLRLHPLDLALKNLAALFPLLLLGFSPLVLAVVGAAKAINVAFQHADLDLRHGWLNYVISTNSVHRWHHSARAQEGNTNYGGVLVVFDLVFGSFFLPPESDEPEEMGLFEERAYPVHEVVRPVVAPLCWARCTEPRTSP